ncbi:carboxypeptidase-like regulatory domain-containing protein [Candidatus Sulfurimonas baltica]|uniref:Carboxypeptidase regulatory-like domain-containing protein n=1 Tax=Candidatus Sulfurimonas baltica TaxID=2740404 RepID=A0A7S7RN21_9BACT|nr:carboxypeptidase-like regulatory domain-containing protein [Candidatus Sulfurimonas baltica]QOY51973.1 carboxypeptidase regulatory-like domain-containing protein [Candidatus Sulfurimonas baltica]
MKKLSLILAILLAFMVIGCSGGGGGDSSTTTSSYSINDNSNNAIMGPLKGATVKIYKLTDLENSIEETLTGNLGAYSVALTGIPDTEMLMISISGGQDVDTNDDGILDDTPTTNSGTIRGLAKASDLKSGNVNVTLLSEVLYSYVKHLIGEVHQDDLEQAMNIVSAKLLKENINRDAISYRDINNFVPIDSESKNKLDFDYSALTGEDSLANSIHNDGNNSVIENKLNDLFSQKLTFNSNNIKRDNNFYKVELIPGFDSSITSIGSSLFFNNDNNTSKLKDFITKDSNVSFTISLSDNVKINAWNGCDLISTDGLTCSIQNISSDRQVSPSIIYKESLLNDNVKDVTNYFVAINDNNYTVSLDLDVNSSSRDFVEAIVVDDIIVAKGTSQRFARKVLSKVKVDDYNYIFETEGASVLDVFSQAGISFNKNLTHDDLTNEATINRSLRAKGMQLLPPRFKGDDIFTIAPIPSHSINRTVDDLVGTWKIWESNDQTQAVSIQGKISFKIKPIIDINTKFLNVKSAKIAYQIENIGEAKLVATAGFELERKISLLNLPSIVTNENSSDLKSLGFGFWIGYLYTQVDVPVFIGVKGSSNTALTVGVGWNTTGTVGVNYSNGEATSIKSSATNYYMLGEMPGTNIEVSVGAFIEPQPRILFQNFIGLGATVQAGGYYTAKAGGEYNNGFQAAASQKVDAKIGIRPRFIAGSYMPDSLKNVLTSANNRFLGNTSFDVVYNIWKKELSTNEQKPAYLEVSTVPIDEILYVNESYYANYVFQVRNTGDEDLHWSLDTSGYLPTLFDISKESGTLSANDTEEITISVNINDLSSFTGQTWRGTLKFSNDNDDENYIEENIFSEFKAQLLAPEEPVNVSITGTSIKKFFITGFNSYQWPSSVVDSYEEEKGFKFYISDYNDTSRTCDDTTTSFITSINEYDSRFEIENDYVSINFDDVKSIHNIEEGKRYCIRHLAYYGNTQSEVNEGEIAVYIPEYGTFSSAVKDQNNNPIVGATIRLTTLSNSTTTSQDGNFEFSDLMPGTYRVVVERDGYNDFITEEYEIVSGVNSFEQIIISSAELADAIGTYNGKIKDAVTGGNISGATIDIREDRDNTSGTIIDTLVSDSNGNYSINTLSTGYYTFNISKDGYITASENIYVVGSETITKDLSISPILTSGEMRIKLSWGENPSDLDSHLVKKTGDATDYHIYYSNMNNNGDSLDTDDTSSFGPETATIADVSSSSTYSYYVYHFSGSSTLKDSSAKVEIYYGDTTTTYNVPNEDGEYWKVFDIINGQLVRCTSNCIQSTEYSGVSRNIDRNLEEEKSLFLNLPSK